VTNENTIAASDDDLTMLAKLRALLAASVDGLDPRDREERISWCQKHAQHGVRAEFDTDDIIRFVWGGRPLALIHRDVLEQDGPLRGEFIADVPDTVPQEWGDQ
jgi:hypothetical protein